MLLIQNQLIRLTVYQQVTDCPLTIPKLSRFPTIFKEIVHKIWSRVWWTTKVQRTLIWSLNKVWDTFFTRTNTFSNIAMDSFRGDFVLPPKPCKPTQTASRDMGPMAKSTEYVDRFCDGDFEPSDALYWRYLMSSECGATR